GTRQFIAVQLPELLPGTLKSELQTIAELARYRLVQAAKGYSARKQDLGFRTYKLSDTSFAKWQMTSDVTETKLEQHLLNLRESADDQASQDALLTELLLKRGYSLTEQIDELNIAGLEICSV